MSIYKVEEVADIIRYAGGKVVGFTMLHKIAYLLSVTDLDDSFQFVYRHYGPFSDHLAESTKVGVLLGRFKEDKGRLVPGANCSTFTLEDVQAADESCARSQVASIANASETIVLEFATAALMTHDEGYDEDPWKALRHRKSHKWTAKREKAAKTVLFDLGKIEVPRPLPACLYEEVRPAKREGKAEAPPRLKDKMRVQVELARKPHGKVANPRSKLVDHGRLEPA